MHVHTKSFYLMRLIIINISSCSVNYYYYGMWTTVFPLFFQDGGFPYLTGGREMRGKNVLTMLL